MKEKTILLENIERNKQINNDDIVFDSESESDSAAFPLF